jgi:hypothetical protein
MRAPVCVHRNVDFFPAKTYKETSNLFLWFRSGSVLLALRLESPLRTGLGFGGIQR